MYCINNNYKNQSYCTILSITITKTQAKSNTITITKTQNHYFYNTTFLSILISLGIRLDYSTHVTHLRVRSIRSSTQVCSVTTNWLSLSVTTNWFSSLLHLVANMSTSDSEFEQQMSSTPSSSFQNNSTGSQKNVKDRSTCTRVRLHACYYIL